MEDATGTGLMVNIGSSRYLDIEEWADEEKMTNLWKARLRARVIVASSLWSCLLPCLSNGSSIDLHAS